MALTPISGGGAFTSQNIKDINSNFNALTQPDIWVRPQYSRGNMTADGTYEAPFATVAGALASRYCVPGKSIGLLGVTTEEASGPIISDISIIGMANRARQATTSGVPNGGGSTWISPSGGTGTLLTVRGQAWDISNIYFNNSATGATTSAVQILTQGDPPTSADGAHVRILNCMVTGANFGVYVSGGTNFVTIDGSQFFNFTGSGDTAIKYVAGAGVGTLLNFTVNGCNFYNNVHSVVMPSQNGVYTNNTFVSVGASVTATTLLSLTGGTGNTIYNNKFGLDSNAAGIGTIVAMGTTPNAGPNFYNEQTEYGQPA